MSSGVAAIFLILAVIGGMIGLFFNILLTDCCTIFVVITWFMEKQVKLHSSLYVLAGLCGIALFLFLFKLHTSLTYILSIVISAAWGYLAYTQITEWKWFDNIWRIIIGVVLGFIWFGMHLKNAEDLGGNILRTKYAIPESLANASTEEKAEYQVWRKLEHKLSKGKKLTEQERLFCREQRDKRTVNIEWDSEIIDHQQKAQNQATEKSNIEDMFQSEDFKRQLADYLAKQGEINE